MLGLRAIFKRLRAKLHKQPVKPATMRNAIEAWEDFDEASMRELLEDITEQAEQHFDELSDSFRNSN